MFFRKNYENIKHVMKILKKMLQENQKFQLKKSFKLNFEFRKICS